MLVNHQNKWELTNDKDICSHRNKDKLWCVCCCFFSSDRCIYYIEIEYVGDFCSWYPDQHAFQRNPDLAADPFMLWLYVAFVWSGSFMHER